MIKGEKKVILELKSHSEEAFNIIYNEYYKLIYYIIKQMVGDSEVANDLTSDTFITMYKKIDQHDIDKSFKYWLVSIAKNIARKYLNDHKKEQTIVDNDYVVNAEDKGGNIDDLLKVCQKILNPLEYDVVNYRIVFNLTYVEIGLMCNISKSEAHRIYKRAIGKLKAEW